MKLQTTTTQPDPERVFSLSRAARQLRIGKATLKGAIERGEVKGKQNVEGHYEIPASQVWQYQNQLETERARHAISLEPTDNPSSDKSGQVDLSLVQSQEFPGIASMPMAAHQTVVAVLESSITRLEKEVNDWKDQSRRWEDNSLFSQRLLTDQRPAEVVAPVPPLEEGRAVWPWLLTIAILLGLGLYLYSRSPVT